MITAEEALKGLDGQPQPRSVEDVLSRNFIPPDEKPLDAYNLAKNTFDFAVKHNVSLDAANNIISVTNTFQELPDPTKPVSPKMTLGPLLSPLTGKPVKSVDELIRDHNSLQAIGEAGRLMMGTELNSTAPQIGAAVSTRPLSDDPEVNYWLNTFMRDSSAIHKFTYMAATGASDSILGRAQRWAMDKLPFTHSSETFAKMKEAADLYVEMSNRDSRLNPAYAGRLTGTVMEKAVEYGTAGNIAGKLLPGGGAAGELLRGSVTMALPRLLESDPTWNAKVQGTLTAAGWGTFFGGLQVTVPSAVARTVIGAGTMAADAYYQSGGNVDQAIDAGITMLAFEAPNLAGTLRNYVATRVANYRGRFSAEQALKLAMLDGANIFEKAKSADPLEATQIIVDAAKAPLPEEPSVAKLEAELNLTKGVSHGEEVQTPAPAPVNPPEVPIEPTPAPAKNPKTKPAKISVRDVTGDLLPEDLTDKERKAAIKYVRQQILDHPYYQETADTVARDIGGNIVSKVLVSPAEMRGEVKSFLEGRAYLRRYFTTRESWQKKHPGEALPSGWDDHLSMWAESDARYRADGDINYFLDQLDTIVKAGRANKGLNTTALAEARKNPEVGYLADKLDALEQGKSPAEINKEFGPPGFTKDQVMESIRQELGADYSMTETELLAKAEQEFLSPEKMVYLEIYNDLQAGKNYTMVRPDSLAEGTKIKVGEHTFTVKREVDPETEETITTIANNITVPAADVTMPAEEVIPPKKVAAGTQMGLLGEAYNAGPKRSQADLAFEEPSKLGQQAENRPDIADVEGQQQMFDRRAGKALDIVGPLLEQDVIPVAKKAMRAGKQMAEDIQAIVAPATLKAGTWTKITFRQLLGQWEARRTRAIYRLDAAKRYMDKLSIPEQRDFYDRMELGQAQATPELDKFAGVLREQLDKLRNELIDRELLHDYYEFYMSHRYKETARAADYFATYSKKPLEGSKRALKQRKFPTRAEAIAEAGLTPLDENPVSDQIANMMDMFKLIRGHDLRTRAAEANQCVFVPLMQRGPEGWEKMAPPFGRVMQYSEAEGGFIYRGDYWMPKEGARIINNYLSPGLRGKGWYQILNESGNLMNQVQLGFSGFHFLFVSMDSMISNISLGFQKLSTKGYFLEGAKDIATAFPVYTQVKSYREGSRLYQEYLKDIKDQLPELRPFIQAIEDSNMGVRQDQFYKNENFGIAGFAKAMQSANPVGAMLRSPGALVELISKPLMDYYVPNIKLGCFMRQADFILRQAEAEGWTPQKKMDRLQEAADSIDNRMGQLKYDNLFWSHTLKDLGLIAIRSLGWNLGTLRELGGGLADSRKIITEGRVTPRTAYTIALPIVTGFYGALTQYLISGMLPGDKLDDPSETYKDFFFPRTGRKLPDGNWERISLPGYMKDVFAYINSPLSTVGHKLHPFLTTMIDTMLLNRDFYGSEIRNPDDPLINQAGQEMLYILKQFVPLSVRNMQQYHETGKGAGEQALSFVGITPAPKYITNTPAQNLIMDKIRAKLPGEARTLDQAEDSKRIGDIVRELRQGQDQEAFQQALNEGQIGRKELDLIRQRITSDIWLERYKRLDVNDAMDVYTKSSDVEKNIFLPFMVEKYSNSVKNASPADAVQLTQKLQTVLGPPPR